MKPVIEKHSERQSADTVKEVYDTLAKLRAAKVTCVNGLSQ